MTIPRPPALRFGSYFLEDKSIFFEASKSDVLIANGLAWVARSITCPQTGSMAFELEIQPVGRDRTTVLVWPENMTASYLKKVAGRIGMVIHDDKKFAHYLGMTAAYGDCMGKVPRMLIANPGWFADGLGFYNGRSAITAQSVDISKYRFEPVSRAPVGERGSLAEWKENIGSLAERNPVILAVACIFIASPFLKDFGLGSRRVNIYGGKGTGKTLCAQIGATIWGNGIDPAAGLFSEDAPYLTKFSTTENGIELVLAKYSPLALGLDELTEQATKVLGELLYKIASGEGKHRMTSNMEAATTNRWLCTIVATSEKSIADAVSSGGKPLLGGQQDRAIDIPLDNIGVITDFGDYADFSSVTRHLKKACGEYYGSAGKAIIQYACDHPAHVRELIATTQMVEERLMPVNCGDGERRVVKFLAAAVVAGHIAIAAGVFNCTPEAVEDAGKAVIGEWWRERGGGLRRVAEFLSANASDIVLGPVKRNVMATAFIDGNLVIIPVPVFEHEFREDGKGILAELVSVNALVREQGKRNKSRFCNNSRDAYVIKLDRLEPIMQELDGAVNDRETDNGDTLLDVEIY